MPVNNCIFELPKIGFSVLKIIIFWVFGSVYTYIFYSYFFIYLFFWNSFLATVCGYHQTNGFNNHYLHSQRDNSWSSSFSQLVGVCWNASDLQCLRLFKLPAVLWLYPPTTRPHVVTWRNNVTQLHNRCQNAQQLVLHLQSYRELL